MEEVKENPSLPSNYVSLLQLRERWLEENERKLKENEEERRREQKLQEQKVQNTKLEETNDRKSEVGEAVDRKHGIHPKSWNRNGRRQFQRQKYNRAVPAKEKSTNADEAMVADPRSQGDEKKKEKRSMENRGEEKNPRAENEEIKSTSRAPENLMEEIRETECELGMRNGKKNVRAKRIDGKKGKRSECETEAGAMAEMEQKLSHLSVSFEIERGNNGRTRTNKGTGQGRRNLRDDQNPRRRRAPEPRDGLMVWVRKDELSNDGSRLGCAESQGHG